MAERDWRGGKDCGERAGRGGSRGPRRNPGIGEERGARAKKGEAEGGRGWVVGGFGCGRNPSGLRVESKENGGGREGMMGRQDPLNSGKETRHREIGIRESAPARPEIANQEVNGIS